MKSFLFLMLLLLILNISHAQSVNMATYSFCAKNDRKIMRLYYNDSSTLFVYNKEGWDTNYDAFKGAEYSDSFGLAIKLSRYDTIGQMVYRNFNAKTIKLRQTSVGPLGPFSVDDDWKEMNWKILKNKKNIAGYACKKAVGYFRGRQYTAWFTEEIKKPYGPWKLFGLPGLIVSAYDNEGVFNVTLTDIVFNVDSAVVEPPKEPLTKTMREYVYYLDHSGELLYQKIKSKPLPKGLSIGKITAITPKEEIRKNSFESKFEWEKEDGKAKPNEVLLKPE